ncbi:hypothetical protein COU56_03050 [Candidatus Pacearchaeota archaeon CG10_big_fil_rev_8_21_14_0_10_31_9]|nr:MAG: hypothetical protein COU56_03050 [Candidatus Pacearchaeota archaeon CG10_big_fil_rev_8_21_14_0_10_31_9]PIZ82701.1 MAG: hypothetical protein COX97_03450 [Candidatus Pacearchaeota archaeon CG_4_10_14_0_2_um_filter_05_32_18]
MAASTEIERKYFLSENHIIFFNSCNGTLISNYAGRSMIDSFVRNYTGNIPQDMDGWHALWSKDGIAYKLCLRRVNLRPYRENTHLNEEELRVAKERGDSFLYDEEVTLSSIEPRDDEHRHELERFFKKVRGLGFREVQRKDLKCPPAII